MIWIITFFKLKKKSYLALILIFDLFWLVHSSTINYANGAIESELTQLTNINWYKYIMYYYSLLHNVLGDIEEDCTLDLNPSSTANKLHDLRQLI